MAARALRRRPSAAAPCAAGWPARSAIPLSSAWVRSCSRWSSGPAASGRLSHRAHRRPGRSSCTGWPRCGARPTDLGHIQSGQFVGYLFPMAPWFAGAKALGLRCGWRSACGWGAARDLAWGGGAALDGRALQRASAGRRHFVAALIFAVNPYVVSFASRATVALLAHAAPALADRGRASGPGRLRPGAGDGPP